MQETDSVWLTTTHMSGAFTQHDVWEALYRQKEGKVQNTFNQKIFIVLLDVTSLLMWSENFNSSLTEVTGAVNARKWENVMNL